MMYLYLILIQYIRICPVQQFRGSRLLYLNNKYYRRKYKMDTKFSVAVHILILISESPDVMNSDQMAGSVGTNASYIRKILSLLKKAAIVDGHGRSSGYSLSLAFRVKYNNFYKKLSLVIIR
ncbi:MAG: Rrf2 family transcriptional regulator [Ruminococcus sp.]